MKHHLLALTLLAAAPAFAAELHVSAAKGNAAGNGSEANPFATITAAAEKAQPGDTITVHAGIYREEVVPPRGGESDTKRIIYQAAKGEKAVITGSENITGWTRVSGDTWKVAIPNARFGKFNPYAEVIKGDWFSPNGRAHHLGGVWCGDLRLAEAANLAQVSAKPGATPLWFAKVDGVKEASASAALFNIASFKIGQAAPRRASAYAAREGTRNAPCSEGGDCVGYISHGQWLSHEGVDFGAGSESVSFRAAATTGAGGVIELRLDHSDGPLIGTCPVGSTDGWQNWRDFAAPIKKTSGIRTLCLVFKETKAEHEPAMTDASAKTEIFAQFPGVDPNATGAEVTFRSTVFTPEKTGIDYITLRGFELCNAATNWAAPTAGQRGLVTAYWNKGWIIEDNDIHDSRCCGVVLGKYSDQWDGKRGTTEGYLLTIADALKTGGWSKDKVGSHIVRRNHIHHCDQGGVIGGMGCAFSTIEGNDIHDIYWGKHFSGAEQGCIKFHGPVDVIIKDNHLWRCGSMGLWLDWMAQGAQATGNLIHDCGFRTLKMEVNHGPNLLANNIILGSSMLLCDSNSNEFAHNLCTSTMENPVAVDGRVTPFFKAHSTEITGERNVPLTGDDHVFNNISAQRTDWRNYDAVGKERVKPLMEAWLGGNVYLKGSRAPACEPDALALPNHDAGLKLVKKDDGWYLTLLTEKSWKDTTKRKLMTTQMLGKSAISGVLMENPDGSPLAVDTDYFGKKRDTENPFPGPFETPVNGEVKVWPK